MLLEEVEAIFPSRDVSRRIATGIWQHGERFARTFVAFDNVLVGASCKPDDESLVWSHVGNGSEVFCDP